MEEFIFENQELVDPLILSINDIEYECYPETNQVKLACKRFAEEISVLQKEIKTDDISQETLNQVVDNVYKLILETIDKILGEGTYNKIFEKRKLDFKEHQKLICYIIDCIKEYHENHLVLTDEVID